MKFADEKIFDNIIRYDNCVVLYNEERIEREPYSSYDQLFGGSDSTTYIDKKSMSYGVFVESFGDRCDVLEKGQSTQICCNLIEYYKDQIEEKLCSYNTLDTTACYLNSRCSEELLPERSDYFICRRLPNMSFVELKKILRSLRESLCKPLYGEDSCIEKASDWEGCKYLNPNEKFSYKGSKNKTIDFLFECFLEFREINKSIKENEEHQEARKKEIQLDLLNYSREIKFYQQLIKKTHANFKLSNK